MTRKNRWLALLLLLLLFAAGIFLILQDQHARIDEWSASLNGNKIEIAEVASDYGIRKRSYVIPPEEYGALVALLRTVTEANSSRKYPEGSSRIDYRLALHYDGKLWLFHCYEGGILGLTFQDRETGAYYGREGTLLYIESPELWTYIVNTVDNNAE